LFAKEYIVPMNLPWIVEKLLGPLRPFIVGKVRDALRELLLVRKLRSQIPTRVHEGRSLRRGLVPLPSPQWFVNNSAKVMEFATSMRDGHVDAYAVGGWRVGDADPTNVDVRSVHELSRMHHWCAYALAAHIDAQHRNEWCDLLYAEITTLMSTAPAEHGTHWAYPMGTGLRGHAMLVAWDWAHRSGWEHTDADHVVAAFVVDHARSTYARRESRGGLSTSHYSANLLGILAAGAYVDGEKDASKWIELAVAELKRELPRQILEDGMVGEASTGYQRQVTDIFVHSALLFDSLSVTYSQEAIQLLGLAVNRCRWLEHLGMPLIGDNDDGLAMKLTGFRPNLSYLYDVAQRLGLQTLKPSPESDNVAASFGLTSRLIKDIVVTMRNGAVGQFGKGGHAHNDQNSITLAVGGEPFVVDAGSSVYTHYVARRNEERSVHCHATMWWPTQEQAYFAAGSYGLFWLLERGLTSEVSENNEQHWCGLVTKPGGWRHQRRITILENGISCMDECSGPTDEEAECVFPLAPSIEVSEIGEKFVVLKGLSGTARLSWQDGTLKIVDMAISPAFGVRERSRCLRLRTSRTTWSFVTSNQ